MPKKPTREESADGRARQRIHEETFSGSQTPAAETQSANNKDVYASLDLTAGSIRLIKNRPELSSSGLI